MLYGTFGGLKRGRACENHRKYCRAMRGHIMQELIKEYRQSLKEIRKLKETAEEHDKKIYGSMITDLEIAIAWMETGRPPGSVKGIYGHYISNAIQLEPEYFEFMEFMNVDGTWPQSPFEEVENRIDKERQAKRRA